MKRNDLPAVALPKRHTLEYIQQLAAARGGRCLCTHYPGMKTPVLWQCAHGHRWRAEPSNIQQGHWCKQCAYAQQRYTIEQMQQLAAAHGGRCLSKRYVDSKTRLTWQCARGHTWRGMPDSVIQGKWCKQCYDEDRIHTLEQMQQLAASRGGRCLSERYLGVKTRLTWQCARGHTWCATPDSVLQGAWCRQCLIHTIEQMQQLAASRGGRCLSERYINAATHLSWQCARGHVWRAIPNSVMQGSWCRQCFILDRTFNPRKRKKYLVTE